MKESNDSKSDVWSLAVISFCLVTSRYPFYDPDADVLKNSICEETNINDLFTPNLFE
jgi:serine/threonine protein kinase